ncbi:MAG TPA: hypothetical protein VF401_04380 [Candidatus Saccharimonadales bacterium]
MEVKIPDVPVITKPAETLSGSLLVAGPAAQAAAVTVLERFTKEYAAWQSPERSNPNPSLQQLGVESAKHGISAIRWLAGKSIGAARSAVGKGSPIDTKKLQELHTTPEEQALVKDVVKNFDCLPAVQNYLAALVFRVAHDDGRQRSPEEVKERIEEIVAEPTDLTPKQVQFALRLDGPQRALR